MNSWKILFIENCNTRNNGFVQMLATKWIHSLSYRCLGCETHTHTHARSKKHRLWSWRQHSNLNSNLEEVNWKETNQSHLQTEQKGFCVQIDRTDYRELSLLPFFFHPVRPRQWSLFSTFHDVFFLLLLLYAPTFACSFFSFIRFNTNASWDPSLFCAASLRISWCPSGWLADWMARANFLLVFCLDFFFCLRIPISVSILSNIS